MSYKKTSLRCLIVCILAIGFVAPTARAADSSLPKKAQAMLRGVHRIVFLGDSITQAGDYVIDCECWLLAHGFRGEVLNLGLASETATDLTTEENAGHLHNYGFPRPAVSERLDRALSATKPDLVFVCYGMNDAGSLPPDATGTRRFSDAITRLRQTALKAGVKRVVICTPPVFDAKGNSKLRTTDENLTRYSTWIMSKRRWDRVDIHTPMRRALDEGRAKNPAFQFAGDGVHPGRDGHWLMAREILAQCFGANLEGIASAEDLFPARGNEIRKLVRERSVLLFDSWMTQIGHKRPGVPGGPGATPSLPVAEANEKAGALAKQIRVEMAGQR